MSRQYIKINDFKILVETLRPVSKITKSAKITVNDFGMKICVKNEGLCRSEFETNSATSDSPLSFCIGDLQMFIKVLSSVENIHDGDFSGLQMFLDGNFLKIESKRFKTKVSLVYEDDISSCVDSGFKSKLSDLEYDWEIVTNSNILKRINSHSFMFSDASSIRIYLENQSDMGQNMIYSTIGQDDDDLENSVTFEFGMVTGGAIGDSRLVLKMDRINLMNIIQSDSIRIRKQKDRLNLIVLVNTIKDNTYSDMSMLLSTLVK